MKTAAVQHFNNALALLQAGDLAKAEKSLKQCIAQDADHFPAHLNLGVLLLNRGAFSEAEPVLKRAVKIQATIESVTSLANVFLGTKRFAEAEQCFRDILKTLPNHVPSLRRMAEICGHRFDRAGQSEYNKKAWEVDPTDIWTGIGYATAVFDAAPAETVAVMDRLLALHAADDSKRAKILDNLLMFKEFHERMKRGLAPFHANSLDELFFTYADTDFALFRELGGKVAERSPNDIGAQIRKFFTLLASRQRAAAHACLAHIQPHQKDVVWSAVTFDPAFYRQLEDMAEEDLTKGLPPLVDVVSAEFDAEPIIYLSCNYIYFVDFAMPLMRSLADKGAGSQLHLHVMDADDDQLERVKDFCKNLSSLSIAVSMERPNVEGRGTTAARAYYHAVRFIRFYQHMKQYAQPLWLMDVDALFNGAPEDLYGILGDKDAAFRVRAGRFEPWNQFNASILGAAPTACSHLYFRLIAAYIAHFYQRDGLRWGIDQLAMYGVFEYLRDTDRAPALAFLDRRTIDYEYQDDGVVWCNSGGQKLSQFADPSRAKYADLFKKYAT